jgi:medium-chain acyl-[acyl-carrier-protein] hydrolase
MSDPLLSEHWWIASPSAGGSRLNLYCFPYAGAAASLFRNWQPSMNSIQVRSIQLPGRASRLNEKPAADIATIVPRLSATIARSADRPFALFGYSLGAILCFEVARWLRRYGSVTPVHLCVAASKAPHVQEETPSKYDRSDEAILERLRALNGTPDDVLDDDDMMQLLLPVIRADFEMADLYTYYHEPPLECPITVFGGSEDAEITRDMLMEWRKHTSSTFGVRVYPGGHLFIHDHERELVADVKALLR